VIEQWLAAGWLATEIIADIDDAPSIRSADSK
jgi:hypothetical protein